MINSRKPVLLVGTAVENVGDITSPLFAQGDLGFFKISDNSNVTLAGLSSCKEFYVAEKKYSDATKPSLKSWKIDPKRITKLERKSSSSPTPQIRYAGFDGSTGSLSYTCDTNPSIRIVLETSPYINKFWGKLGLTKTFNISTECCDTCDTGCGTGDCVTETLKFVEVINSDFNFQNFIGAELVTDGTFTASDNNIAVVYGSTQITFTTAATYNSGTSFAVGDLIRLGGTGATNPVYKITAVNSLVITLDTPYQNATGTISAANAGYIATDYTKCGIKFTGKFLSITNGCCCFPPFPFDFEGVTFNVSSDSFGCSNITPVAPAQNLSMGNGTSRELMYTEMDALGYSEIREWFRDCAMNAGANSYTTSLTADILYTVYYIHYSDTYPTTEMGGNYDRTDHVLIIATPTSGGAVTNLNTAMTNLSTNTGVTFEAN